MYGVYSNYIAWVCSPTPNLLALPITIYTYIHIYIYIGCITVVFCAVHCGTRSKCNKQKFEHIFDLPCYTIYLLLILILLLLLLMTNTNAQLCFKLCGWGRGWSAIAWLSRSPPTRDDPLCRIECPLAFRVSAHARASPAPWWVYTDPGPDNWCDWWG